MIDMAAVDYANLVMFATFMASFQSPFSAYLAEYKGSGSYVLLLLVSFISLVISAFLGVTDSPAAYPWLFIGALFAVLVYVAIFYEETIVSRYTTA